MKLDPNNWKNRFSHQHHLDSIHDRTLPSTPSNSSSCLGLDIKPTTVTVPEAIVKQVALGVQSQLVRFFCPISRRVIIIAGPTGVGKTELSLQLAKKLGGEIVSADSMQVYRGMDIGTAKVSFEERQLVPHHLIDIRNVDEPFHVHDYYCEAKPIIESILARGRVPIVVGGTGLYIHALMYGPPQGPPSDKNWRTKLQDEIAMKGLHSLYERLCRLDPDYAKRITPGDAQKITRALEIIEISGRKVSEFEWHDRPLSSLFDFRFWFLSMPREKLYRRLNDRCLRMIDQGLIDEVMALDSQGIRQNSTAANAIGYRQTLDYLDSAQSEEDYRQYVTALQTATRHLAKRQMTWFRKEKECQWLDISSQSFDKVLEHIIDDYYHGPFGHEEEKT